jgi:hypothetical protein
MVNPTAAMASTAAVTNPNPTEASSRFTVSHPPASARNCWGVSCPTTLTWPVPS